MNAFEKRTTNRCKKLHELPLVVSDWQQTVWRPDCDYYDCGRCDNPKHCSACPFDGKALPLHEVAVEPPIDQLTWPLSGRLCESPESRPRSKALEQAIEDRIVKRTGARIRMLEVKMVDNVVIIRGCATCYYVKQLALQGAHDVLGSSRTSRVELNVHVPEPTMSVVNSQ